MALFFLPQYVLQYLRTSGFEKSLSLPTYAQSLLLKQALFFCEGLQELVQLVIHGECLAGDDSSAYDRSIALSTQTSELNCCTAVHYLTVFSRDLCCWRASIFKNNLRLSNILVELDLAAKVVLSGKGCLLELAQQLIVTYVYLYWGGMSFTTARSLVPVTRLVKNISPQR